MVHRSGVANRRRLRNGARNFRFCWGDCLFCHALKLSSNFEDQSISRKIAEASNEVCSGEILQTQRRFDLKLSIPEYIKIISMKTGALFRICTELAAVLNGCRPDEVLAMRNYGDYLGIAYQIYDDCLDLVGTEGATGKTVGTDLAKGKLTLPLLHLLAQASEADQERLHSIILHGTPENRIELLAQVVERGRTEECGAQDPELSGPGGRLIAGAAEVDLPGHAGGNSPGGRRAGCDVGLVGRPFRALVFLSLTQGVALG